MSLKTLQELHKSGVLAQSIVKGAVDQVLFGLNFLHESDMIHTGKTFQLKPNFLAQSHSIFLADER